MALSAQEIVEMKTLTKASEIIVKAESSQPLTREAHVAVTMVRFLANEYHQPSRFSGQFKAARLRHWINRAEREIGGAA